MTTSTRRGTPMTTADSIAIPAYAKINLAIRVGGPEPATSSHPGWHRIVSWMSPIALHDDVTVRCGGEHEITWAADAPRPTPIDWPIEKDLVVRAIAAIERHLGRSLNVSVAVRKRIPVGGGLGGGSSDAAATLLATNELCRLGLDARTLRHIGATLGSDVPFFIDDDATHDRALAAMPRSAIVADFGEVVRRVPTPVDDLLLVVPPFGCDTRAVYRAFDATPGALQRFDVPAESCDMQFVAERAASFADVPINVKFNDLFLAACAAQPALGPFVAALRAALARHAPTARFTMTGSGSTLLIVGASDATALAGELADNTATRDVVIVPTRTLARVS